MCGMWPQCAQRSALYSVPNTSSYVLHTTHHAQGAKIMTIDQVEGNEPIHENFGTQLGNEIDEVSEQ